MNRLLQALGLMRVSEHERIVLDIETAASECRMPFWEREDSLRREIGKLIKDCHDWQAKHASVVNKLADWEAKFKKAITDLAAARDQVDIRGRIIDGLEETIADLRPDALAMRRKREMDRDRRKGKVS